MGLLDKCKRNEKLEIEEVREKMGLLGGLPKFGGSDSDILGGRGAFQRELQQERARQRREQKAQGKEPEILDNLSPELQREIYSDFRKSLNSFVARMEVKHPDLGVNEIREATSTTSTKYRQIRKIYEDWAQRTIEALAVEFDLGPEIVLAVIQSRRK
jgi:hypothetical protein